MPPWPAGAEALGLCAAVAGALVLFAVGASALLVFCNQISKAAVLAPVSVEIRRR